MRELLTSKYSCFSTDGNLIMVSFSDNKKPYFLNIVLLFLKYASTRWKSIGYILSHHITKEFFQKKKNNLGLPSSPIPVFSTEINSICSFCCSGQTAQASDTVDLFVMLCYAPIPLFAFSAVVSVECGFLLWITIILPTGSRLHYGLCGF